MPLNISDLCINVTCDVSVVKIVRLFFYALIILFILYWQNLQPITIRVVYEIKMHVMVFITNPSF